MTGFCFSNYLLSRYREHRNNAKKKGLNSESKVLYAEYSKFIMGDLLKDDGAILLDEDVRMQRAPNITQIDYLVKLVYLAFSLTREKGENFSCLMQYRTANRIDALKQTHLSSKELDFISEFFRLISQPSLGLSHRDSLDCCLDKARKFVSGSQDHISEGSITYETLRKQVVSIAESIFFRTPCPSPTQREDYQLHDYFQMNLKEWLACNPKKILDTVHCGDGENKVEEYRLSLEVMMITRGILTCLKNLHDKFYFYDCELVSFNILISDTYEVKLRDVKLRRDGSVSSDFTKLKEVIKEIVSSASSSSGVHIPEDVSHFMNLLSSPLTGRCQEVLYDHSCIWTPYEVVKNVCMFRVVCNYNRALSQKILGALIHLPDDMKYKWRLKIPKQSRYYEFATTKWQSNGPRELELLTFMRDAYPHAHGEKFRRQGSIPTERELFAMFPSFMAHFVELTSKFTEFTEVYANSGCDYIKVPVGEDTEPRSTQSARSAQGQEQPQLQILVPPPQYHPPIETGIQIQRSVQMIPQFQAQSRANQYGYPLQLPMYPQPTYDQYQQYQQYLQYQQYQQYLHQATGVQVRPGVQSIPQFQAQHQIMGDYTRQHMGQPPMLAPQQQQYHPYGYPQQLPMHPQPTYEEHLQYQQYHPR